LHYFKVNLSDNGGNSQHQLGLLATKDGIWMYLGSEPNLGSPKDRVNNSALGPTFDLTFDQTVQKSGASNKNFWTSLIAALLTILNLIVPKWFQHFINSLCSQRRDYFLGGGLQ